MERIEQAVAMFEDGYSCAQAMLAAFCEDYGLDRQTALRLASPLGGGISRTDGICGAASGAILVLGLARGHTHPDDEEGQDRVRVLTRRFLELYAARKGGTLCTEILGHNLSLPGVPERVKAEGLSKEPCPAAVRTAGQILLELLEDGPAGP